MSRGDSELRHYWDACLFLDLVNATPGRVGVLSAMWDDLLDPEMKIVAMTSYLTVAEVAFSLNEKEVKLLDVETLEKIDGFWAMPPHSPIHMIELYDGIAREARDMIRDAVRDGLSLKANDAIHFASAKRWKASCFWTYDKKLLKFSDRFGFSVEEPRSDRLLFEDS